MRTLATILFGLAFLSSPVSATVPDILINGGTEDFSYQQFPSGPIVGTFGSSGSLIADPATEGTAATTYVLDGFNYLTVVGALEDGANFVDGGVLILKSAAPITTLW